MNSVIAFSRGISVFLENLNWWQTELIFLVRIVVGGIFGFIIGLERSRRQKEAGMGTHFTVGLAAALFTCIGYAFDGIGDAARIAAQVVTGIGFLGAGIIFFRRESLHGLTTAAIVWSTAAIGMCCGVGMYILALGGTVLIVTMQIILHTKPFKRHNQRLLLVKFHHTEEMQKTLQLYFGVNQFYRYKVNRINDTFQVEAVIRPTQNYTADKITRFVAANEAMISIERLEDL